MSHFKVIVRGDLRVWVMAFRKCLTTHDKVTRGKAAL